MSATSESPAERRRRLVARSDALRSQLSSHFRQFEGPIQAVGLVAGLGASLRRSPWMITALTVILMKTPWGRLARIPRLVWRGWRILRFLRGLGR